MSLLTRIFSQKSAECLQIGLSEDEQHYCLAYWDKNSPIVNFYPKSTALNDILTSMPFSHIKKKQIIRPVPYHYIWRKYLIQPFTQDKESIFRLVVQTIKQELPIAIDEVYFDYQVNSIIEQNLNQIIIFALRKRFAEPLLLNAEKGLETLLDCELHCWQRGLHYLLKATSVEQYYVFKEKYFEFKLNELVITSVHNEKALGLNQLNLSKNIISPELYVLALGALLWK